MSFARKLRIFVALAACAACTPGAEPPDLGIFPDGESENPGHLRERPVATFEIDTILPEETSWLTVPLRGRGPAGGLICYWNQALKVPDEAEIDGNGNFCIDLQLLPGKTNSFVLQVCGVNNSRRETVTIDHKRAEDSAVPIALRPRTTIDQNFLVGSEPTSNLTSSDSFLGMTDGNTDTAVRVVGHPTQDDWIQIPLSQRVRVSRLEIQTSSGCPLDDYTVFVSDGQGDPGPPGTDGWQAAYDVRDPGLRHVIPLEDKPWVRHVGILLKGPGCAAPGRASVHEIVEVEAIAEVEPSDIRSSPAGDTSSYNDTEPETCADGVP